jgi:hypothetical protein
MLFFFNSSIRLGQTKDFRIESYANISYSDKPDKYSRYALLEIREYNFDYQYRLIHNGKKFHEHYLQFDKKVLLRGYGYQEEKSVEINVDSILNPRSDELELKNNQSYCKISSQRVPKQSLTIKFDSTLNLRLKRGTVFEHYFSLFYFLIIFD